MTMFAACVFLYLSVLLMLLIHELGHALSARKHGLTVSHISIGSGPKLGRLGRLELRLIPLAGACHLPDYDQASPPAKREIALMGPLFSIIAGVLLWLAASGADAVQWGPLTFSGQLGELLAAVSIAIGLFNLIPLPPLDGWQVLTAGRQIPERVAHGAYCVGLGVIAASYTYPLLS